MKKQFIFVLIVILTLALFVGCDPDPTTPSTEASGTETSDGTGDGTTGDGSGTTTASSAALITAYASDYIVGTPEIDTANKTVAVTIVPMDISGFTPAVTVSEKATITPPSSIQDGVPAEYTVKAEDGTEVKWTVTVTVQYGITFSIDGTVTTLTGGFKNSGDTDEDEAYGSGVPGIVKDSGNSENFTLEQVHDLYVNSGPPSDYDYSWFEVDGVLSTVVTGAFEFYHYNGESFDETLSFDLSLAITKFGSLGGDFVATFSGTEASVEGSAPIEEPASRGAAAPTPKTVTGGFAKFKVVESGPGGGGSGQT